MTEWSLHLLGDLVLASPDGPRRLRLGRKSGALLLRVAAQGRLGVSREHLAFLLWGTQSPDLARNALRQCLHLVRGELGPAAACIEREDNRIVWRDDLCPVDLHRFEALAGARQPSELMSAVKLYRGDLVDAFGVGPDFEQWLDAERERLRALAHGVIAELATQELDAPSAQAAQDLARRLLTADRLHEGACLSLMRLYAAAGLRSKALEVHAEFAARLQDELGLEPGPRIAALAAGLSASGTPTGPAASPAETLARHRPPVDSRITDLMLRGWQLFTLYTAEGMAGARASYAEILELDPCDAGALSMLGWTHWFDAIGGWSADAAQSLAEADRLASRALARDDENAAGHALAGKVRLWQLRHAQALEHLEHSLQLAGGGAYARFHLGDALMWCGRPAESLQHVDLALQPDGNDRGVFQTIRGMALWMAGDPHAARAALESATRRNPRYSWAHRALAVLHHEAGEPEPAQHEAELARQLNPRFGLPFDRQGLPFLLPEHRSRFARAW